MTCLLPVIRGYYRRLDLVECVYAASLQWTMIKNHLSNSTDPHLLLQCVLMVLQTLTCCPRMNPTHSLWIGAWVSWLCSWVSGDHCLMVSKNISVIIHPELFLHHSVSQCFIFSEAFHNLSSDLDAISIYNVWFQIIGVNNTPSRKRRRDENTLYFHISTNWIPLRDQ